MPHRPPRCQCLRARAGSAESSAPAKGLGPQGQCVRGEAGWARGAGGGESPAIAAVAALERADRRGLISGRMSAIEDRQEQGRRPGPAPAINDPVAVD